VQVVEYGFIDTGKRLRQEIGLFLIVTFEANAIAATDDCLKQGLHILGGDDLAIRETTCCPKARAALDGLFFPFSHEDFPTYLMDIG